MKLKNATVLVQLFFLIVVVAILATHFRVFQVKELFETPIGVAGQDKSVVVSGRVLATEDGQQLGNNLLPDVNGNVILRPDSGRDITLDGTTVLKNELCFIDGANRKCFNSKTLSNTGEYVLDGQSMLLNNAIDKKNALKYDTNILGPQLAGARSGTLGVNTGNTYDETLRWDQVGVKVKTGKELEFGFGENKEVSAGKIRYGGWDNALNIVGAGQPGQERKVRIWDKVAVNNEIELGAWVPKEPNAGKIRYGGWDPDALNIVGAGLAGQERKVRVWDKLCIGNECVNAGDLQKIKQPMPAPVAPVATKVSVPRNEEIELGVGIRKEANAGKIRYGGWDDSALNIVGAGRGGERRKVRVWDDIQIGNLIIQGDGCIRYGRNMNYTFCLQPDGNLVQYKDNRVQWATNKYG